MRKESTKLQFLFFCPSQQKLWRHIPEIAPSKEEQMHKRGTEIVLWHHVCGEVNMSSRDYIVNPYNRKRILRRVALLR